MFQHDDYFVNDVFDVNYRYFEINDIYYYIIFRFKIE